MHSTQSPTSSTYATRPSLGGYQTPLRSTVSWGAIFAGVSAALALQVLFVMLFAGLGFAIYSPIQAADPLANLSIGALLIHSICAIISLCLGGWVAGRFSSVSTRATAWLHGFGVWCAATVGGVLMVALGAGWMLGGLSSIVGGGLSAIGQPIAAVADGGVDLAADAAKQSKSTITSFVEEAVSNLPEDGDMSAAIRAEREVGMAVARLFNPLQESNTAANREQATAALVEHTAMSQAEANRAVTDWTETYERLQDDLTAFGNAAAEQAREAADTAASAVAKISLLAFVGFLFGALGATGGGHLGALSATKCEQITEDDHSAHDVSGDRPSTSVRHGE